MRSSFVVRRNDRKKPMPIASAETKEANMDIKPVVEVTEGHISLTEIIFLCVAHVIQELHAAQIRADEGGDTEAE